MPIFDAAKASLSYWGIIKPFWASDAKAKAWALLGSVVALDLVSVWLLVVFTTLRKTIYDGLEHYQQHEFMVGIGKFFAAACFFIFLAVYKQYLRQSLEIRWREWLTKACLSSWMRPGIPARLELRPGSDNPDQRVSEDVATLCQLTLSLSLGLLSSVVTLASFFGLLWAISGPLDFKFAGMSIHIPGYMALVAILYAMIGSTINHFLGRRLIHQSIEQQQREADLRYSMMRTRESAEAIALLGGEGAERGRSEKMFERVRLNWREIMTTTKRITGFGVGYSQVAAMFPLIVAAPRYFAKEISLGDLMQISSAFGEVQGSLSWFIGSYSSWVSWKAACERLRTFFESVATAQATPARAFERSEGPHALADGLVLCLPDGSTLLDADGFHAKPGEWIIIQGPSGSGKSSLLKALSGLWREGDGKLSMPASSFFIPQKPFIPPGTVEEALCYPQASGSIAKSDLRASLEDANLACLLPALESGDESWPKTLSGGEAQRLGFARAFLAKPEFLFLDEATSAQDENNESLLMLRLKERLPCSAVVSAGHRSTLAAHHFKSYTIESTGARSGKLVLTSLDCRSELRLP